MYENFAHFWKLCTTCQKWRKFTSDMVSEVGVAKWLNSATLFKCQRKFATLQQGQIRDTHSHQKKTKHQGHK